MSFECLDDLQQAYSNMNNARGASGDEAGDMMMQFGIRIFIFRNIATAPSVNKVHRTRYSTSKVFECWIK